MKKIFLLFLIIFSSLHGCETGNSVDWRLFSNDIKVVQEAINEGADVNASDELHRTPLINAVSCNKNKLELAKMFIDSKADVNSKDIFGTTALIIAVVHDELDVVKLLIDSGADINIQCLRGNNALMCAIENWNTKIAKLLIDAGSDLNAKSYTGYTALILAERFKNTEIATLVKNRIEYLKKQELDFIKASQEGEVKKLAQSIELGININAQDEDGFTALMRAVQGSIDPEQGKNKLEIVKILLDKGAIYNLKDNTMHYTALKWARENGNTQAEELLKAAGATE